MKKPLVFSLLAAAALISLATFKIADRAASAAIPDGKAIFQAKCASCHQANGRGGGGGMFPALAGNAHVTASDPTAMLTTIEHGRGAMPAWKGQISAGDIAAVATYIRSSWGNNASAVTEADVTAIK